MTLVRFEPFRGFEKLSKRFNDFANEFDKGVTFEMGGFNPRVDIVEDDKALYLEAELPGVKKEAVNVSVNEENILTIKGEKQYGHKDEEIACLRSERSYGEFMRSFQLPDNADSDNISANYDNGVLILTVPKKEPEKPKVKEVTIS